MEEALLAALRDSPGDELTWSALADWLEESESGRRAELLRLTRRVLPMPVSERGDMPRRYLDLLQAGVRPVVVERVNSIGMRFALVPAGRFLMGSPPEEEGRLGKGQHGPFFYDETQHDVELTRSFWLGVFAVTQRHWKAVMGNNPSWFCENGGFADEVHGLDTDDFPVEHVSWEEVQEFIQKLNEWERTTLGGWKYSLPSEAQWEYSCRGGAISPSKPFYFRTPCDSLCSKQANFNGNHPYGGGAEGPRLGRPCTVGSYEPNPLGLYDMHGNVWEWCQDWQGDYAQGPVTDPVGPSEDLAWARRNSGWDRWGPNRVVRGGSHLDGGYHCRAANRYGDSPSVHDPAVGFRVAIVPLNSLITCSAG
jgi:uncharacterized protein (TIGR02996 family)